MVKQLPEALGGMISDGLELLGFLGGSMATVKAVTKTHSDLADRVANWAQWALQLAYQIDPLQPDRLAQKFAADKPSK